VVAFGDSRADAQEAKIVGLGAVGCTQFSLEIKEKPALQREYLAWAQGFMNGVLLRAPTGVDEGLDLLPPTFPLLEQLEFLKRSCIEKPSSRFADAVIALYRRLRSERPT
jgi:hypothetical protein